MMKLKSSPSQRILATSIVAKREQRVTRDNTGAWQHRLGYTGPIGPGFQACVRPRFDETGSLPIASIQPIRQRNQ